MESKEVSTNEDTLKTLIEKSGLTQKQLAKRVGKSLSTITYWVSGEKLPRVDHFLRMAKALNVSPKQLAEAMGLDVSELPDD